MLAAFTPDKQFPLNPCQFARTGTRHDADAQFFAARMHLAEVGERESTRTGIQRAGERLDCDIRGFAACGRPVVSISPTERPFKPPRYSFSSM